MQFVITYLRPSGTEVVYTSVYDADQAAEAVRNCRDRYGKKSDPKARAA